MRRGAFRVLCALLLCFESANAQTSLPQQTIVVFNRALPESIALAKFYAQKRGIAADHLVGLDCSRNEEISRAEYDQTIAEPLRAQFRESAWWQMVDASVAHPRVSASSIHFVALIKGMPLKIRGVEQPYPGDKPGQGPIASRTDASVDSELAALSLFAPEISGAINNPYFQASMAISEFQDAPVLVVCRLDAPDEKTVRRMITDAIETEKTGLWGRAFVDGAHNTTGALVLGDIWMSTMVDQLRNAGVPVVFDDHPGIFPDAYPVSDCALYYGWYAGTIGGAFAQPKFKFLPGAIAAHIHSYSAETLRDPGKGWSGALLLHGAAATIGNVYEPYLQLTTNLDLLNERLLKGFTFGESVYMATRGLSWMNIAVGDPLYRPFGNLSPLDPKKTSPWRAYRDFAKKNRGAADYRKQAVQFALRTKNALMLEDVGLMELRGGNFDNAIAALQNARARYSAPDDVMRCVLEECDAWRTSGKPERAVALARDVLRVLPDAPGAALLREIAK